MSEADRSAHLIGPAELQSWLADRPETVVLDVRHVMPADHAHRDAYLAGHLPGAQFVDALIDGAEEYAHARGGITDDIAVVRVERLTA